MTEYPRDRVFSLLVGLYPEWRKIVGWKPNACIAAARVGNEVLSYFGITSVPVPVAVQVHNARARELMADSGLVDQDDIHRLGGYTLGTDPDVPPIGLFPSWNCHLVLWTPNDRLLIDLTLEQYARPDHGIVLTSAGTYVPEDASGPWLAGDQWLPVSKPDGTRVMYRHRPEQVGYRTTPDWKRGRYRKETATLIRLIRSRIANPDTANTTDTPEEPTP